MKVNGTQEISPRVPLKSAPRVDTAISAGESPSADTVDSPQIAEQAMAAQASNHEKRVDSIASQVKQGTYIWPSSQQIADRIMDEAELTARLQAIFRG
jgi:hypothetical protein